MSRVAVGCAILACLVGPAPVPDVGPGNVAPPPRPVKPDLSLIVLGTVSKLDGTSTFGAFRIGFRNGTMLSPETVWRGEDRFVSTLGGTNRIVAERYLVTQFGGVIDLNTGKVINHEENGRFVMIDGMKVMYRVDNDRREKGIFTFELETAKLTRLGNLPPARWFEKAGVRGILSPDLKKVVEVRNGDELVLHREGEKTESLGKGFQSEVPLEVALRRSYFTIDLPILWLDADTVLTQRENGKLVTVDLTGKVTEVANIKDVPKKVGTSLFRDRTGTIVYSAADAYYKIDVAKPGWEKSEWMDFGHGFEASWVPQEKFGYKLRHHGKEIGQFWCWPHGAVTAPGYIALKAADGQERALMPQGVAVWSAARGEWATIDMYPSQVVGWIK